MNGTGRLVLAVDGYATYFNACDSMRHLILIEGMACCLKEGGVVERCT